MATHVICKNKIYKIPPPPSILIFINVPLLSSIAQKNFQKQIIRVLNDDGKEVIKQHNRVTSKLLEYRQFGTRNLTQITRPRKYHRQHYSTDHLIIINNKSNKSTHAYYNGCRRMPNRQQKRSQCKFF